MRRRDLNLRSNAPSAMNEPELKICPRCGTRFECGADAVWLCQCAAVPLSEAERRFIASRYRECLCAACLRALKAEWRESQAKRLNDV